MCPNKSDGMANSVEPDETAPIGAESDLHLHCLLKSVYPKT